MANNTSAFNPEHWASAIQRILDKSLVGKEITNFEYQSQLVNGTTIHVPYIGNLDANDYVDASGATIQDVTPSDETLVINKTKEASFYVQEKEIIQNKYSTAMLYQKRAGYALRNAMDTQILAEVTNAGLTLTAGDLTGGSGTGSITATTSNIIEIFTTAMEKLQTNNVTVEGTNDLFAVIPPSVANLITQKMASGGFNVTDAALKNGYAGDFLGFQVYISNNVYDTNGYWECMFGKKGCTAMVVQKQPSLLTTQAFASDGSPRIGKNYVTWDLYGGKTFQIGAQEMVDVKIAK